jgi:hypothetical protein
MSLQDFSRGDWDIPMLDIDTFLNFKSVSEEKWRNASISDTVWGLQIQAQTRLNPGLTDGMITQYEISVGASFHPDFKTFLRCMNGTDHPGINVLGSSGEPPCFAPTFYSYPRDLERIRANIEYVAKDRVQLTATLAEQGFHLPDDANLIPIFGHRYVVCSPILDTSPVLSIWEASDAIVYGRTLLEYLEKEVLSDR